MAKKIPTASSDSSLSSPPENTASATETAAVTQPAVNGKKRKAETTPRTRRSTAQHVDIEDDVEGTDESSEPKRRVIKKAKITEEVEIDADGDGKVTAKTSVKKTARGKKAKASDEGNDVEDKPKPKAKTKTKTKTAKIEPPRAERTKDIKHRIGAHVSIAGG
jgi:AP endonuclease-1